MIPTGDFDRLRSDIIERYQDIDIPITFGVLIADYRQQLAREYILNYVKVFDKESNKYIDFFIPGYAPFYGGEYTKLMDKDNNRYFFNKKLFEDFVFKLNRIFGVPYENNPMLVLIELDNNNFVRSRKMVLDLGYMDGGIQRSCVLFKRIFDIARRHVSIDDFSHNLASTYIKEHIIDLIIDSLEGNIITELNTLYRNIRRFRVN